MRAHALRRTLRSSLTKNGPEVQALLAGNMPRFVVPGRRRAEVPVFVFHAVAPEPFEAQLRYLGQNGYRTLDADQLEARLRHPQQGDGREVALTFDDATWSFWAYALPLLRRHGARAILFAIPGIVPDDPTSYPNLEDLWAGRCSAAEIAARARVQPLCTWRELQGLHESGLVDLQAHSLTHARIPVSAKVEDFVHPRFDAGPFANSDLPIAADDDPRGPARRLRLGAPVFRWASRLSGRPRFIEAPELTRALADHVGAHGGAAFFARPSWRRELTRLLEAWPEARRGRFETPEETRAAIRDELTLSKDLLEARLPGKAVRHFCYPWFEGCALADRLAAEAGYRTVHGGVCVRPGGGAAMPLAVQRISEEYLYRLPGEGRGGIAPVWLNRVRGLVAKGAGAS